MSIYKVTVKAGASKPGHESFVVEQVRLVRAKTKATARNHTAAQHITVEAASDDELITLTKAGVEVEHADKE